MWPLLGGVKKMLIHVLIFALLSFVMNRRFWFWCSVVFGLDFWCTVVELVGGLDPPVANSYYVSDARFDVNVIFLQLIMIQGVW